MVIDNAHNALSRLRGIRPVIVTTQIYVHNNNQLTVKHQRKGITVQQCLAWQSSTLPFSDV